MVNGTSGFSPIVWQKTIQEINMQFPNDKSLGLIKKTGAYYIVFEKEIWQKYNAKNVLPQLLSNNKLKLIQKFDNTYVFRLL